MTPPPLQLIAQRCHHHGDREAVARCPECGLFYCRECVTEHDDRVICASCLRKSSGTVKSRRQRFAWLGRLLVCGVGILVAWLFFYSMGRLLLLTPTSFHEGTLWENVAGDR
ncbi:MAG: rhomboid family protein [Chthoniobacteraceae bacterium]